MSEAPASHPAGRFWRPDGSFELTETVLSSAGRIAGAVGFLAFVGLFIRLVVGGYTGGPPYPSPLIGTVVILAFLGSMFAVGLWILVKTVSRALRKALIVRVDGDGITLGKPAKGPGTTRLTAWADVSAVRTYGLTWEIERDDKKEDRFGWFVHVDHRDGTADRRPLPDRVGDGAAVLAAVAHVAPHVPVHAGGRLTEYYDPLT